MFRLMFICIIFTALQLSAKHQKLNLQKAIDLKLVKVKATSLGGHAGFCIQMQLTNLGKDSLVVLIEAGRRLNSLDEKDQDILIVQQQVISLRRAEEKTFSVKGYCCQASKSAPKANARYDVNKLADSSLVKLARYLNLNIFDEDVEQQSVWAISDKHPAARITSKNDSLILPLRCFVADIKGEKLPWYTVVSRTYVYNSGAISVFPLLLKGKMQYSADKDSYITLSVLDEKGQQVCLEQNQWFKAASQADYNVALPVKGLAKGKYTIELKTPEKQLAKQEFEL